VGQACTRAAEATYRAHGFACTAGRLRKVLTGNGTGGSSGGSSGGGSSGGAAPGGGTPSTGSGGAPISGY
jgi:hypothetical protein